MRTSAGPSVRSSHAFEYRVSTFGVLKTSKSGVATWR
jgi:hypothetical protein